MPAVAVLGFVGARVSVTSRDERERERERDLGFQRRRSSFYKHRGGGGFHPGRRSDGGGSGGLGLATELLAGERRTTTIRIGITARWVGPVPVAGWAVSAGLRPGKFPPLFFTASILFFYFLFSILDMLTNT
jgi:hypothetical protein